MEPKQELRPTECESKTLLAICWITLSSPSFPRSQEQRPISGSLFPRQWHFRLDWLRQYLSDLKLQFEHGFDLGPVAFPWPEHFLSLFLYPPAVCSDLQNARTRSSLIGVVSLATAMCRGKTLRTASPQMFLARAGVNGGLLCKWEVSELSLTSLCMNDGWLRNS